MMGRKLFYLVWSLRLFQYCSRCIICNYLILVQYTIHILSGGGSCIVGVAFYQFELYIPMVRMVCVINYVQHLPVHMLRVQGWFSIAATC